MSTYRRVCDDARTQSTGLGHDLERRWTVAQEYARAVCTRCNASVVVRFFTPVEAFGAAVESQCKDGNVPVEEPQPTAPPTDGQAMALPMFTRQRVPVAVR